MHTQPNITSFNAQDLNGREIASRFNEDLFEIYFLNTLDINIDAKLLKKNIKIINILAKNKFLRKFQIFKYKLLYKYDVSFYIRVFKSDSMFLKLLPFFDKNRKTIHMVENLLPYPADDIYNETAKYNALHSTKTFSISKKVQESVLKYYGINTDIVHVGVDTNLFHPSVFKKRKKLRVVSCGSLQPRKQPLLFVEIAKIFPDIDFVWIGEGELKDEVLKQSKDMKNFKLLANKPHKELAEFFANSDIFLFSSLHEGFPKVVIESMACGLPSIVFDRYGPEAVIEGETGFIVKDKEEMIEKLRVLIKNDNLRKEFSNKSIERAKEFDWNKIVKKWENIIISKKGSDNGNIK